MKKSLFSMQNELNNLETQFNLELSQANDSQSVEALRVKYLGRKSLLNDLFSKMASLSKEGKALWGKNLNLLKNKLTEAIDQKASGFGKTQEKIDLTVPGETLDRGSIHILSAVNDQICSIFEKLGFKVVEGTEIEDEWHNFTALNIPLDHPSRDAFDTFYLDLPEIDCSKHLLRSHTSPVQARVLKNCKPPVAVISPGRVYRPDQVDASHSFMFHQIEGFVVAPDINFSHLKGVLLQFAREFFSPDVNLRFRPHFFPFTEPSAEVDVSCIICEGNDKGARCSMCKGKGWLEILGCGMIHPNVLKACGIDFKKYKGFAFGMGVERPAILKYGIDDIRLFYENDIRFLEQF
jgi:phenylalanyl-tRNA synthetase alpha chain